MSWPAVSDEQWANCGPAAPALDVQILYEDKAVGARAKSAVERVADQFGGPELFRITLWRLDLLQNPVLRGLAGRSAAVADVLLFSVHGRSGLPEAVSSWVSEWLAGRTDAPPALVVSLDSEAKGSPSARELLARLEDLTRSTHAELIPHYGPPASIEERLTIDHIHYRAEVMTSVLDEALRRTERSACRHWGIND